MKYTRDGQDSFKKRRNGSVYQGRDDSSFKISKFDENNPSSRQSSPSKKDRASVKDKKFQQCPPINFAGIKQIDDRAPLKKSGTIGYLADLLGRAKILKYNNQRISDESSKVKLNRRKVLNDDEL